MSIVNMTRSSVSSHQLGQFTKPKSRCRINGTRDFSRVHLNFREQFNQNSSTMRNYKHITHKGLLDPFISDHSQQNRATPPQHSAHLNIWINAPTSRWISKCSYFTILKNQGENISK
uniref:Uncharacterized protein n=1 Tax=Rhizophora mucronata TaxID=61149 RepID=A0A2P2L4T6_RHIMU